tara:strand:- start:299 stop:466 length:168 start_codon:yes stop_codon:yes gene_type:complete
MNNTSYEGIMNALLPFIHFIEQKNYSKRIEQKLTQFIQELIDERNRVQTMEKHQF